MSMTTAEIKALAAKGKELATLGVAAASLIGLAGIGSTEKQAAILRIVNGTVDAAAAIAALIVSYSSNSVEVPEIAELENQLAVLRAFQPLPTE